MRSRTSAVLAIVATAWTGFGCTAKSPAAPATAVSPPGGGGAASGTVIPVATGYVMDSAFNPVAGARVEILDGPQAGASLTSGANGQFTLSGQFIAANTFRATKDGYVALTQGFTVSAPGGSPWLAFYLHPRAAPVDIAGDYTLTFTADSSCPDLPSEARTRSYPATIARQSETDFILTATGARFLGSLSGFTIGVAGDSVGFWLHGGHDPVVVEQLGANRYLAFSGVATTPVTTPISTISTAFTGWIDYCATTFPMDAGYTCGLALTHAHCESANHRLTLSRR